MSIFELIEKLKVPDSEFTPIPFWFLNDKLDENELIRQIDDFHAKGVNAFVLHPRIGIPRDIPYMSEVFLAYIGVCIERAHSLGMKVVLYDEGMYPSGSACGQVVAQNLEFASRKLYKKVLYKSKKGLRVPENKKIIAVYNMGSGGAMTEVTKEKSLQKLPCTAFILGYTGGHIRGIHPLQDDGSRNAPPSADLLNPSAVDAFISLTHEVYYKEFSKYFGNTVIGFFTDEPSITGRGGKLNGALPWSEGLLEEFRELCGYDLLPALFDDYDPAHSEACLMYRNAVQSRLERVYYKKLSDWCGSHGIALMGHPRESGDIGVQKYFHVPGQDLVWRYITSENNLSSPHAMIGKCSSDAARHYNRRRNSNEVFGVCGAKDDPWDFPYCDMIWYINHLCVRGVNMIFPHAFYYSLAAPLQYGERPPDVGPGNIWWEDYREVSDYIKRLCLLNTDCKNSAVTAVLCSAQTMPCEIVARLYEKQIPFNYIQDEWLENGEIRVADGLLHDTANNYKYLLADPSLEISDIVRSRLDDFICGGGQVFDSVQNLIKSMRPEDILYKFICTRGNGKELRLELLFHGETPVLLAANEGRDNIMGIIKTNIRGKWYCFEPLSGETSEAIITDTDENETSIKLELFGGHLCAFICDTLHQAEKSMEIKKKIHEIFIDEQNFIRTPKQTPEDYFGIITYTGTVFAQEGYDKYILKLPDISEQCSVFVNGILCKKLKMKPFSCDISALINTGSNELKIEVQTSAANKYGKGKKGGIIF